VSRIYLDYNASTPVAPIVLDAMLPFLKGCYGNPSSKHWASEDAAEALAEARAEVAALLGAKPSEVVFTSGGSESNNQAIKGVCLSHLRRGTKPHLVISNIEHPSVRDPAHYLEGLGVRVTEVGVDRFGMVDPAAVADAIEDDTVLVSIMHANNEVGTIQPIARISAIAHARGVLMHSDAAQSVGKVPTNVNELGVDLLTMAGHKLYAPKGIGALFIREGVVIDPYIHGAGHEAGRRSGTENVPYAVGLGTACELARKDPCGERLTVVRDQFWQLLQAAFGKGVALNGHPEQRLPNTLNVSFVGKLSPDILTRLDDVAASTGAACHAGSREISPVLAKMGIDTHVGLGAIRFSIGRSTSKDEVEAVVERLRGVVAEL